MNEVSGANNQAILQELGKRNVVEQSDGGQQDFLKLLVAQLENQNPLSPQESGEFLAQLAQFSTVEGVERLNQSFESFASGTLSNQALQATALVGRSVQINSNVGQLNQDRPLTGAVDLPASTSGLTLNISDLSGSLVRQVSLGSQAAGRINFGWDGTDSNGSPVLTGPYRVTAEANIGGERQEVPVLVNANVNSVSTASGGGVTLNLEGNLGSVSLNDVSQIN